MGEISRRRAPAAVRPAAAAGVLRARRLATPGGERVDVARLFVGDQARYHLGVLRRVPDPTAALAAEPDDALAILRPLGLFPNRFRSVVEVSTAVLTNVGPLDVGMEAGVNKIYGIGEFGVHSFEVFCRGDLDARPADKTLQAFVAWQKRQNADDAARK